LTRTTAPASSSIQAVWAAELWASVTEPHANIVAPAISNPADTDAILSKRWKLRMKAPAQKGAGRNHKGYRGPDDDEPRMRSYSRIISATIGNPGHGVPRAVLVDYAEPRHAPAARSCRALFDRAIDAPPVAASEHRERDCQAGSISLK
jgi:hypothetical protein